MARHHHTPALFAGACFVLAAACATGASLPTSPPRIEKVIVNKAERTLILVAEGQPFRRYPIALGRSPEGHKLREGDNRTPEGVYRITGRLLNTEYHHFLIIDYPSPADRRRASQAGVEPGGGIMIHGQPTAWAWLGRLHLWSDWTYGCIALTNSDLDEIMALVTDGTRIEINP